MCLGTFSRLRRSLATSTLYAAVRILAERFLLYRKAISCKVKKSGRYYPRPDFPASTLFLFFVPVHSARVYLTFLTVHPVWSRYQPLPVPDILPSDSAIPFWCNHGNNAHDKSHPGLPYVRKNKAHHFPSAPRSESVV